ncbi:GLPGLI family protein [Alloprevotella tannerae]|uniref:GLPGLI family protein n=1 Tax=Alloprevotella tannerae TaxID=76122 RepID=A0A929RWQ2_9BACT|nr:GLPGLI family protein [Alloprevotella tannerae]MBF0969676.1 GLPGLI family protein [Alloprevotella tannerae]
MKAKRLLYFILTALFVQNLWAQESTVKTLRIVYNTKYTDPIAIHESKDVQYLDIQDGHSAFYSSLRQRSKEIEDSLNHRGSISMMEFHRLTKPYSHGQWYYVYKGLPAEGKLTYLYTNLCKFKYEEPISKMKWKMLGRDSVIAGYPCQLAETNFRGRTWKAWFTLDIPIPNGPWKLGGLPGLILKATDHTGWYDFDCAGIQNITAQPITVLKENFETMKPKEYFRLLRLRHEHFGEFLQRQDGASGEAMAPAQQFKAEKLPEKAEYIEVY